MKADVAAIQQEQAVWGQFGRFEVFPSHGLFAFLVRIDDGVVSDPIEDIVKNGNPGDGSALVFCILGHPETVAKWRPVGQQKRGTVHGENPETLISLQAGPSIQKAANDVQ